MTPLDLRLTSPHGAGVSGRAGSRRLRARRERGVRVEPRAAKHLQVADWDPGAAGAAGNRAVVTDTGGWELFSETIVATHLGGGTHSYPNGGMRVKGREHAR